MVALGQEFTTLDRWALAIFPFLEWWMSLLKNLMALRPMSAKNNACEHFPEVAGVPPILILIWTACHTAPRVGSLAQLPATDVSFSICKMHQKVGSIPNYLGLRTALVSTTKMKA